ncbi:MAG: Na+/H+ antiporter NhaC family protein [Fretibacterium sp.]|nr:Na+/H+ antiporter NhaC family protein [Fretibacterium sp.]
MDLVAAFVVFAGTMIASLVCGFSMLWALSAGFLGFMGVGVCRGFAVSELLRMSWEGMRASLIVIRVMLTIGVLTGLWRSAGTFAVLTAWGLQLITPSMFVLAAFLLSCALSYAIGTSFGAAGTLGVALMTLARSGGVNELVVGGAILSGIYFGDRASPASSCANLVAALTGTELYDNVRLMMRTAFVPFLIALGFYLVLSLNNPMLGTENPALTSMNLDFNMSPWAVLPAVLMLALPPLKVKIFHTFLASIACAFLCTLLLQGQPLGIMMTVHVARHPYERKGLSRAELAQDIANSTVVTAGLVPWCIGCSVPLAMLGVPAHAVPHAAYLWLLPLCYALTKRRWFKGL